MQLGQGFVLIECPNIMPTSAINLATQATLRQQFEKNIPQRKRLFPIPNESLGSPHCDSAIAMA